MRGAALLEGLTTRAGLANARFTTRTASARIDGSRAAATISSNEKRRREDGLKPAPFAYAKARSLAHAIELLANDDARLLAGGQSLIATLNMRLSEPALLVDINGIGGLDRVALKNAHVEIGALVRYAQAERSAEIARAAPLIALALPHIGHPAIRNRGTVGGSLAFADPAAELPACVIALDGEIEIVGPQGQLTVKADEFFKGLFETALTPRDVLTAIRVPAAGADTRVGFAEFARRHGDYAMVGLAACARADGKRLGNLRLVYFGVGATPVRARRAEPALADGDVEAAVKALADDLEPADDVQASGAVKTHLASVLLRRVAQQLARGPS
jgi:aerobic carbon-monoxide dehydrogenase medium subunit